ncbi:MAG: hypothetical protein AAB354_14095 [candidate division KSB1 bacterium]
MNTITAELRDNRLILPTSTIEQLGWRDTTKILIEKHNGTAVLRPLEPTAKEISDIACIHLIEYVGDATAVKTPVLKDDKWQVEVVLAYRPETIGHLTFTRAGQLVENESDSPAKLKGITN